MPTYTIELSPEQDAALDVLIPRANAALPEEAKPYTKASYVQARAAGVADNYVEQLLAEETQNITDAYKTADDAKKAAVKSTLGVVEAGAVAATARVTAKRG